MGSPLRSLTKVYYFNSFKSDATYDFGFSFKELIQFKIYKDQPIILLCIGTDRSTGDSLGPLVGYKMSKLIFPNTFVYGTLSYPVHALNLDQALAEIYAEHECPFIIAIDASLGSKNHVGYVTLTDTPLRPGLGVKKSLPAVGDISITGIVNMSESITADSMLLQSTRLSTVMNLADCIVKGIRAALLTL